MPGLREIWQDVERYDLVRSVAELEAFGFTVISPEKAAPAGLTDRLLDEVLDRAEDQWGVRLDPEGELPHSAPADVPQPHDWSMARTNRPILYTDFPDIPRVFEEALLNPVLLALVSYLLGYQCLLSSGFGTFFKGIDTPDFPLHFDGSRMSPPSALADCANALYLLTDHSVDDGATCFVPGSHRLLREPAPGEGLDERVAAAGPKGSLVVWHGNTWHGAFAKTTPGLRISMPLFFCRPQLRTFFGLEHLVTKEMLDRNPPRFATLMGQDLLWGSYQKTGGSYADVEDADSSRLGLVRMERSKSIYGA